MFGTFDAPGVELGVADAVAVALVDGVTTAFRPSPILMPPLLKMATFVGVMPARVCGLVVTAKTMIATTAAMPATRPTCSETFCASRWPAVFDAAHELWLGQPRAAGRG